MIHCLKQFYWWGCLTGCHFLLRQRCGSTFAEFAPSAKETIAREGMASRALFVTEAERLSKRSRHHPIIFARADEASRSNRRSCPT